MENYLIFLTLKCLVVAKRSHILRVNIHFINITKTLDLKPSVIFTYKSLPEIIETFKDHPSIKIIFL